MFPMKKKEKKSKKAKSMPKAAIGAIAQKKDATHRKKRNIGRH